MKQFSLIKHDIVNGIVTIKCLASSMQPVMSCIFEYIEDQKVAVVSSRELEILKESLQMLEQEADKLLKLINILSSNGKK